VIIVGDIRYQDVFGNDIMLITENTNRPIKNNIIKTVAIADILSFMPSFRKPISINSVRPWAIGPV